MQTTKFLFKKSKAVDFGAELCYIICVGPLEGAALFCFRGTAVFEAYSTLTDKCTATIDKSAKERIFYEKCPQFGKIVLYFCAKV